MGVMEMRQPVLDFWPPTAEVPTDKHQSQLILTMQMELDQHLPDIPLDRIRRDPQFRRDLPVGVFEAGQGGNILLARRKGLPMLPEFCAVAYTSGRKRILPVSRQEVTLMRETAQGMGMVRRIVE